MTSEPGALERTSALPTGTVTFLFTDIEGSTQRWEQHREAMDAAVKRNEALLKSAIERHHGYVFKTVGDAVCATFARVSDAISATADAQRALNAEDFSAVDGLRVRMGVHTGEASERDGDYFGPAVNRVARLMSLGHGGQVLLSAATRDLAQSDLPTGTLLVDLGLQRLKDLTQPEQVWQLNISGLPMEFPALKSLDALPNNLPIQRTTFVGREHDVAEVKELIGRHHLLTLVGSGGVGKTRLALQVGAELLDHYPDGVWFADFAPITDPELVSSVTAQVLGMTQQEGKRVDESIPPWLKRKKLLLIFDNCEHVLEAVAMLAAAILGAAPDVRVLTTSRQALDISGEKVSRLASLDVPHKVAELTPQAVMEFGAVALFVDRASLVDKSFALSPDNAPIVADICRRLDGIPLAIELAAARVRVLSIPNLAHRLNERFKILTGGSRDVLPRQKTLSALIDWSYDLLGPQEQLLFRRLGIFAGGFGLDAATKVCGGDCLDEIEILDLLTSLTDKSLVVADTSGQQERYHLLESTRAYALEKLTRSGERESLARRHAEYFRDQAQAADEARSDTPIEMWLERAEPELDNFRAALEWSLGWDHDVVLGGALAGALESLWFYGGLTAEGRYWISQAQAGLHESEQPRVVARLWLALVLLSSGKRAYEAGERARMLYESMGDERWLAWVLIRVAFVLANMGRLEEAAATNARAHAAAREHGNKWVIARSLNVQGVIMSTRGDFDEAREPLTQSIAAYKELADEQGMSSPLHNLAIAEFKAGAGNAEQALHWVSVALEINSRSKNIINLALNHVDTGSYHIALGDLDVARESLHEAWRYAHQAQDARVTTLVVLYVALLRSQRGEAQQAARLVGWFDARIKELGLGYESNERWGYGKLMTALHEHLSEHEIAKLAAEGATWSEDQAVEEALKL